MKDFLYLGSAPISEDCVQIDQSVNYLPKMIEECYRYADLLRMKFPIPKELIGKVAYSLKKENHEFGTHYEVIINFDDEDDKAMDFAYNVESNLPEKWED